VLDSDPGYWDPEDVSLAYQWKRDGKAIAQATKTTYKIATADVGKRVTLTVTASKAGYQTASGTSNAITAKEPRVASKKPKFTGVPVVGKTLTAKPGTWKPRGVKLSYQWLRNGKAIKKATKSRYKLVAADAKKKISLRVTGKMKGYESATRVSSSKKVYRSVAAVTPKIRGTAKYGKRLTVSKGAWKPSGIKFKYQWKRDGVAVSGATRSSYKLRADDVGRRITVTVTGKLPGVSSKSKTSKPTKVVSYPSRTDPISLYKCPAWAPIKGNWNSGIYHMPGQRWYSRTQPEDCFSTESAARKWGYRKAKV